MDKQKTDQLYERFSHLYRERSAPLASSKMAWGFQCEDGWYKILYDMSKKITKLSSVGLLAPAASEVARWPDGTLRVEVRNLTPPVADIITSAREQSRLTCEYCSYSPAFVREDGRVTKGHVVCGRCIKKLEGPRKAKKPKRRKKPLRPPDTIIIKR